MKSQQPANSMVLIPIGKMIGLEDEKKNYRCFKQESSSIRGTPFYLPLFFTESREIDV